MVKLNGRFNLLFAGFIGLLVGEASAFARVPTNLDVSLSNSINGVSRIGKPAQTLPCGQKVALRGPASINSEQYDAACPSYMDGKGSYDGSSKGQFIAEQLQSKPDYYAALLDDKAGETESMKRICPKYKTLLPEERIRFWVWTFAAISKTESTCGKATQAEGMHGKIASGEFQLEEAQRDRKWRGRSWGAKGACAVSSIADFKANALCALDIMVGQFKGEYGNPKGLAGASYWQELKTTKTKTRWQTSPIIKRIKEFPLCN